MRRCLFFPPLLQYYRIKKVSIKGNKLPYRELNRLARRNNIKAVSHEGFCPRTPTLLALVYILPDNIGPNVPFLSYIAFYVYGRNRNCIEALDAHKVHYLHVKCLHVNLATAFSLNFITIRFITFSFYALFIVMNNLKPSFYPNQNKP